MPIRRPCRHPWCPAYAEHFGYCGAHYRPFEGTAPMEPGWPKVRAAVLARDGGRCTRCGAPAAEVHHLTPRAEGGTDDPANLTSLCGDCHHRITGKQVAARRATQEPPDPRGRR